MARKPANERASERIPIGAPATLKFGEQELTGFVEVVNTNGMFVASPRAPEIGDYIELVFSLPGDRRSFRVRGNVVFLDPNAGPGTRRPGFGARFERPPVTLLDAIKNLNRGH
jgi:Tfp pilus assembly protein PilZ